MLDGLWTWLALYLTPELEAWGYRASITKLTNPGSSLRLEISVLCPLLAVSVCLLQDESVRLMVTNGGCRAGTIFTA